GPELAASGLPVTLRAHGFDYQENTLAELLQQPYLKRAYLFPDLHPALDPQDKVRSLGAVVDTSRHYPVLRKNRRMVLRAGACLPTKDLGCFVEVAAMRPEYRFVLALSSNQAGREVAEALLQRN